ncbi:transcription/translation regulatory transformer protein RfaH [Candidatus Poribacteria bacterium]|nr:transcription/translation regulatory transformer protein RfaH [Candidatus Poribacteria bacterium]
MKMKRWFVVYTKPKKEWWAEDNINRMGFETFLPRYERMGMERPLFPRYLFVRFDPEGDPSWPSIRYARGVVRIVSFHENGRPTPVPQRVIEEIKGRQDERGLVRLGKLPSEPKEGDPVRIIDGPLRGLEGIFLEDLKDGERVIILLSLMGRQVKVTLEGELLDSR